MNIFANIFAYILLVIIIVILVYIMLIHRRQEIIVRSSIIQKTIPVKEWDPQHRFDINVQNYYKNLNSTNQV